MPKKYHAELTVENAGPRRHAGPRSAAAAEALASEAAAWEGRRNAMRAKIDWTFRTADARVKLFHLYPYPEERQKTSVSNHWGSIRDVREGPAGKNPGNPLSGGGTPSAGGRRP